MDKSPTTLEELRVLYCPPLDDGLFYAISSDYDLNDPEHIKGLHGVLDQVKEEALKQEDATFDPSGTGGMPFTNERTHAHDCSSRSSPEESSTPDGITSVTSVPSELKFDTITVLGEDAENLSIEKKLSYLAEIFPQIPESKIFQLLQQCGGGVGQAAEELLNASFLVSEHDTDGPSKFESPKGVDAFAVEDIVRKRKGRNKNKFRFNESSRDSSADSFALETSALNVWESVQSDAAFICARTNLSLPIVKSVYHAEGADLGATIRALAMKESWEFGGLQDLDPVLHAHITDLKTEFPTIPDSHLFGLLVLTRKIPSAAFELAECIVAGRTPDVRSELHAQYAPLDLRKEKENQSPTKSPHSPWTQVDHSNARSQATIRNLAADVKFSQASTYHKLGKSNHLMKAAAAYYSTEGHKHLNAAKEVRAAAADAHVSANSTSTSIDLHGVSVSDAVRIAKYRVEAWWEGLGDAIYASGSGGPVRTGFRVVTGVGRHSRDGAPRIGPAVSKALMKEGWKVEIEQGELIVRGKRRR